MPYIDVTLFEGRLDSTTEPRLLAAITDAVASVLGEEVRPATWVVLQEIPRTRWGFGGVAQPAAGSDAPADGGAR